MAKLRGKPKELMDILNKVHQKGIIKRARIKIDSTNIEVFEKAKPEETGSSSVVLKYNRIMKNGGQENGTVWINVEDAINSLKNLFRTKMAIIDNVVEGTERTMRVYDENDVNQMDSVIIREDEFLTPAKELTGEYPTFTIIDTADDECEYTTNFTCNSNEFKIIEKKAKTKSSDDIRVIEFNLEDGQIVSKCGKIDNEKGLSKYPLKFDEENYGEDFKFILPITFVESFASLEGKIFMSVNATGIIKDRMTQEEKEDVIEFGEIYNVKEPENEKDVDEEMRIRFSIGIEEKEFVL